MEWKCLSLHTSSDQRGSNAVQRPRCRICRSNGQFSDCALSRAVIGSASTPRRHDQVAAPTTIMRPTRIGIDDLQTVELALGDKASTDRLTYRTYRPPHLLTPRLAASLGPFEPPRFLAFLRLSVSCARASERC